MQYTITISGRQTVVGSYSNTVSASQLNMVLTIDKTLDYGSFVVRNNQSEPFEVGDMVDIDITDGTDTNSYHFIVSADDVTQLPNGFFVHSVTIIELTKILEWQNDSNRSFTQKLTGDRLTLLDVVEALQATIPFEQTELIGTTRVFSIDNTLKARLAAIESPEFQFNNRNLKEMLFEIFDFIGAIPRLTKVSNDLVLVGDFYNERGQLITTDSFHRMKRLNINEFSTALDSDIKNLFDDTTTVVDPAPDKFKFLTSNEGLLTEDNAIIRTDYPIVEVESLIINTGDNIIDITDSIIEREEWEQLKNIKADDDLSAGRFRDNTFFFTRYQNNITNLFDKARLTSGVNNRLDAVVFAAGLRDGTISVGDLFNLVNDFRDVTFRIVYKSLLDTRVQAKRMDTGVIKYDSQVTTGQSGNIIRADRALDRLFKLQQLLGNAEVMTSERITQLNELHDLGDFKDDDFIITTIEMICEKGHILTKYLFSENFQKVSDFVDVDSEIRLYDIPARTFRRNVYVEDIVEIDLEPRANTSFVTADGINTFANTIRPIVNANHNTPVGLFVFDNLEIPGLNTDNNVLIKTQTAYTGGNSINFHAEFDNPKIAGFQLDNVDRVDDADNEFDLIDAQIEEDPNFFQSAIQKTTTFFSDFFNTTRNMISRLPFINIRTPGFNIGINYTDIFGEVVDFKFQFAQQSSFSTANSRFLPVVARNEITRPLIDAPNHRLFKDGRENLAITYSLHVLPVKGLENRVIVGKYLVERNNLLNFVPTASNQFEVFTSDQPYSITENAFSRSTDTIASQTYSVVPYEDGGIVSGFVVGISQAIAKEVTWGIRKKNTRELVFVVNPGDVPIGVNNPPTNRALHFTFNDRQSFVQYPNQTFQPGLFLERPTNFAVVGNPTSSSISLSWTDPNDPVASNYEIEISTNLVQWESFTTSIASRTFSSLPSGTFFTFRVRAIEGDLFSEYAYVNASTARVDPNKVQGLQLTLLGNTSILVNFEELDNVFAYFIQISESNTFTPLLPVNGQVRVTRNFYVFNRFNTPALTTNKQYFIRVRAIRGTSTGVFSDVASITTPQLPITSSPQISNVIVEPQFVQYTVVNRNDDFATLFADIVDGSTQRQLVAPNESITITQAYTVEFNIVAKALGVRDQSMSQIVTRRFADEKPPNAPGLAANGIVENVGINLINFTYSGAIVDGFLIERNPNELNQSGFGIVSPQLPPNARKFIDETPLSGQTYTYRVRAFNRVGEALSAQQSVTSLASTPNAPSNLFATVIPGEFSGSGTVELSWQRNSTNEDGFTIERKLFFQSDISFTVVGGTSRGQTSASINITGDPDTTYVFRVIAFNRFGSSNPSNTVNAVFNGDSL